MQKYLYNQDEYLSDIWFQELILKGKFEKKVFIDPKLNKVLKKITKVGQKSDQNTN